MEWIVFWCLNRPIELDHMLYHRQFRDTQSVRTFVQVNDKVYHHDSLVLKLENHPELVDLPDQLPDDEPWPLDCSNFDDFAE